jgi:hypothetical protein
MSHRLVEDPAVMTGTLYVSLETLLISGRYHLNGSKKNELRLSL